MIESEPPITHTDSILAKERFKSFLMHFVKILHSYNTDRASTEKKQKTVLSCQNVHHFGNSTLFDLEGIGPRFQNFGQK